MVNAIRILVIRFNLTLSVKELPLFRGAINSMIEGGENTLLFHNHTNESHKNGLRYAYPLIQYKRIGGKAAIVCVGEGAVAVGEFFSSMQPQISLGDRQEVLEVESVVPDRFILQVWQDVFSYHLRKWLPLNQDNYETYNGLESIVEKVRFLENILIGNMLSMAKTFNVMFDKKVMVKILDMSDAFPISYKGVKMMAFDIEFKSNVYLPDFIGLGKGVSLGMGMVTKIRPKIINNI